MASHAPSPPNMAAIPINTNISTAPTRAMAPANIVTPGIRFMTLLLSGPASLRAPPDTTPGPGGKSKCRRMSSHGGESGEKRSEEHNESDSCFNSNIRCYSILTIHITPNIAVKTRVGFVVDYIAFGNKYGGNYGMYFNFIPIGFVFRI